METFPAAAQLLWRIDLLGGLSAHTDNRSFARFQTEKTAVLFAYLAYYLNRRHSREELIDLLWPDADLDAGRNRLSQAVGWLRTQLEPPGVPRNSILFADRQSVALNPSAVVTDAGAFESAVQAARSAAPPKGREALERARDLYRGDLLPGYYDDWILTERQRLQTLFLGVLRQLAQVYEQKQDWTSALDHAHRALTLDPLDEELHAHLIRLLAAGGRPAKALRQYQELERILNEELGAVPSDSLQALREAIRRQHPVVSVQRPAAASERIATPPLLPAPLTRFFGREVEITQIERLIVTEGARLVTLTGVGGAGKTRLATEALLRLRGHFQEAVWFVPLADLSDARLIPDTIADMMRLPRSAATTAPDQIVETLSLSPSLLVLDNVEHLLEGAIAVIRALRERVPELTVLATSRQRLNLEGEREIAVPPLSAPPEALPSVAEAADVEALMQFESVRLFVDRAQTVRPSFTLTARNAPVVARLCARLEGLPLAVELCAAWAQTLTPAQMLTQLTRRFDLLVSRRADIPARHRTLRAALEYSFLLLPTDLQQFFIRLSLFRGGWTLEAAEAVCFESDAEGTSLAALDAITQLRERSLLVAEENADELLGGEMRYRMLETLREFAAQQRTLAMETPLRKRHAHYFLSLAERAEPQMTGAQQAAWLTRLEAEHENLRAVLAWALEAHPADPQALEIGLRLAVALTPFWDVRGYSSEGQEWLDRLLTLPAAPADRGHSPPSVRAKALNAQGILARARGDFTAAETAVQEALRLWREQGDDTGTASALQVLATLAYSREDYDGARAFLEEALQIARRIGNTALVAAALLNLGNIALELKEWPQARALYAESLSLRRAEGNPKMIADALNNLGLVARYQNDLAAARTLMEESLTICRELSDRSGTAITLLNLGTVHRLAGRYAEARSVLEEAAILAHEIDNRRALAWCIKEFGHLACAQQAFSQGVRLLAASENQRLRLHISFHPADPEQLARDVALAQSACGEARFAVWWEEGSRLTTEQALTEALTPTQD